MKGWLVAVAAVIIVTSCAELILPSGRIKNACRTAFALVCLSVMLRPLFLIVNDGQNSFTVGSAVDTDYVNAANDYYCRVNSRELKKLLTGKGYPVESAEVTGEFTGGKFAVEKVFVKLENSVISGEDEHIICIEEITSVICSALGIASDKVAFYGE